MSGRRWVCDYSGAEPAATLTLDSLGVGTRTVSAVYTSLTADFPGSSGTLTGDLDVASAPTSTTVRVSSSPAVCGQPVTLTANVMAQAQSTVTPTGSVQFVVDGTDAGTPVTLDDTGTATFTLDSLGLGTHTISAIYASDSTNFQGSTGTLPTDLDIYAATTDTTLTYSSAPSNPELVALQVTVAAQAPSVSTPTGSIQFVIHGVDVGQSMVLDDTGTATITLDQAQGLALAAYGASAVYTSDTADFLDSTATLPADEVTSATTTLVTASSAALVYGQAETFTATVTPQILGIGQPTGTVHS